MRFVASGEEIFKAYNSLIDGQLILPCETMVCMEGMPEDEWAREVSGLQKPATSDNVNHPSHYNDGKIEVIEFIEDKKLGFHLGNAVKYISRAGKKNPDKLIEDLRKAIWYINRRIELTFDSPRRPNDMQKDKLK